jgi:hypothetical protein
VLLFRGRGGHGALLIGFLVDVTVRRLLSLHNLFIQRFLTERFLRQEHGVSGRREQHGEQDARRSAFSPNWETTDASVIAMPTRLVSRGFQFRRILWEGAPNLPHFRNEL